MARRARAELESRLLSVRKAFKSLQNLDPKSKLTIQAVVAIAIRGAVPTKSKDFTSFATHALNLPPEECQKAWMLLSKARKQVKLEEDGGKMPKKGQKPHVNGRVSKRTPKKEDVEHTDTPRPNPKSIRKITPKFSPKSKNSPKNTPKLTRKNVKNGSDSTPKNISEITPQDILESIPKLTPINARRNTPRNARNTPKPIPKTTTPKMTPKQNPKKTPKSNKKKTPKNTP